MTANIYDDREKAFEAQYARKEEARLVTEARTLRSFCLWAAGVLGHDKEKALAYADAVIEKYLRGQTLLQIIESIREDLQAHGVVFTTGQLIKRLRIPAEKASE